MGRSDKWKNAQYFGIGISNPDANPVLLEAMKNSPDFAQSKATSRDIIGVCRELIVFVVDDHYEFDLIGFSLDAKTGNLMLSNSWRIADADSNSAKEILATCMALDIPVYPEDDEAAIAHAALVDVLLTDGFQSELDGKKVQLRYSGKRGIAYDSETATWEIDATQSISPGDAIAAARRSSADLQEVIEARALLHELKVGIEELKVLLSAETRNEHDLQRCLTAHPVFFGLDYKRVIPKYRLGSEYELDYALEKASGQVDLVEIEASTHALYTKSGNPRSELVHAEQQVLDWLEWYEANARLVRDDFPEMMKPSGQIVIGRSTVLTDDEKTRLRRRNAAYQGSLQILTYDDVLKRAEAMLAILTHEESP